MNCPNCGHSVADYEAFCSNCGHYILPLQAQGRPVSTADITEDGTSRTPPAAFSSSETQAGKKVAQRVYPPAETAPPPVQPPMQNRSGSSGPRPPVPRPAPQPPVYEEPVYDGYDYDDEPSISQADWKRMQRLKIMAITFGILALIAVGVLIFVLVTTSSLQVQLNKAQRENHSIQATVKQLETKVDTLTDDLDAANQEKASLGQQVAELTSKIGSLETDVNQSQYDKDAAVRDMDDLKNNLAAAEERGTELETELEETKKSLEDAEKENDELKKDVTDYKEAVSFYDAHVVFAMQNAEDKHYHLYGCPKFTKKNVLVYSAKSAESNGYTPCPDCIGEN